MTKNQVDRSQQFLTWINKWVDNLPTLELSTLQTQSKHVALISEDMLVGFTHKGNLASPVIAAIIPNVVEVFRKLHSIGVAHFLLFQDTHDPDAEEFHTYPPHCIAGSEESQTIPELKSLLFSKGFTVFEKNSLSSFHGTKFQDWLDEHLEVDTFIVVGNCTDICVYQGAVNLKLRADAKNVKRRVIVPANAVATYDLPIEVADKIGATPHDASFLHNVFLYHMRLNGVEVVKDIS